MRLSAAARSKLLAPELVAVTSRFDTGRHHFALAKQKQFEIHSGYVGEARELKFNIFQKATFTDFSPLDSPCIFQIPGLDAEWIQAQ